jgi:hypothetical protein
MAISVQCLLFWFALPLAAVVAAFLGFYAFGGRFWGVSAALMGPCIAVDGKLTANAPGWVQAVTLGFLLLALALLQLYGQQCNNRDRQLADAEIRSISAEIRGISAGVRDLSSEVRSIESERARQSAKQYAFLAEQGALLGGIADAVRGLADEIRALKESEEG